jgi:hypothetical protein
VRQPLTLIASEDTVRIAHVDTEVARHVRSYDRGRRIEDRAHLERLADDKRRPSLPTCMRQLLVFVDAHRPWRHAKVTDRRAAPDFAQCMRDLVDRHYVSAW